jgi:small-conductance mechanosensitive channel
MITLQESLTQSLETLITFLPKAIGAAILVLIGMIVGRLVSAATRRILGHMGADRVSSGVGLNGLLRQAGIATDVPSIIGATAHWVILLLFVITAVQTLGLSMLSGALRSLVSYLPDLMLAIVIGIAGLIIAKVIRNVVEEATRAAELPHDVFMGQAAYVLVLVVAVIMSIAELGVDTSLLNAIVLVLVTGVTIAGILSLGFGGRTTVANLLAAYSLRPVLEVGQHVRAGDISGTVSEVTLTAVVLEVEGTKIVVPADQFGAPGLHSKA